MITIINKVKNTVGGGFSDTGEHTVRFVDSQGQGQVVFADYVSASELVCTTPAFTLTGQHAVHVAQNGQDYEQMNGFFNVF